MVLLGHVKHQRNQGHGHFKKKTTVAPEALARAQASGATMSRRRKRKRPAAASALPTLYARNLRPGHYGYHGVDCRLDTSGCNIVAVDPGHKVLLHAVALACAQAPTIQAPDGACARASAPLPGACALASAPTQHLGKCAWRRAIKQLQLRRLGLVELKLTNRQ